MAMNWNEISDYKGNREGATLEVDPDKLLRVLNAMKKQIEDLEATVYQGKRKS